MIAAVAAADDGDDTIRPRYTPDQTTSTDLPLMMPLQCPSTFYNYFHYYYCFQSALCVVTEKTATRIGSFERSIDLRLTQSIDRLLARWFIGQFLQHDDNSSDWVTLCDSEAIIIYFDVDPRTLGLKIHVRNNNNNAIRCNVSKYVYLYRRYHHPPLYHCCNAETQQRTDRIC